MFAVGMLLSLVGYAVLWVAMGQLQNKRNAEIAQWSHEYLSK